MTQRNNILQELKELESSLAALASQNIYAVPEGYFEGLSKQVLNRIKAMEAGSAAEELSFLSTMLRDSSRQMPYSVPSGYFEHLDQSVMQSIRESSDYQTADEELQTLSPLLSGLKKEMPFSLPEGYFENIASPIKTEESKPETKIISLTSRKWFRYAAAAIVAGVIATIGFMSLNTGKKVDVNTNSQAWVKKGVKKVSTEKIEEFIQLTDEEKTTKGALAVNDSKNKSVKDLIKDVPDNEIQSLLNDTQLLEDGSEDTSVDELMN